MLRSTRGNFFKKRFPKLDFLKTVSVPMIANSEKIKRKKFHPPYDLCISSPLPFLVSPTDFLRNCSPYPVFFGLLLPSFKYKAGQVGRGRKLCAFI